MQQSGSTRDGPLLPAWVALCAVGAAVLAAALWNLSLEIQSLGSARWPAVATLLTASLSVAVLGLGIRLRRSGLDGRAAWVPAGIGLAGGALAVGALGLTMLIRAFEGRPISEPAFPLIVAGCVGVIGGYALGEKHVEARRAAREAAEARNAMAFTNSLLRHDVRNGLQVISGHAELLRDADDESVRDSAVAIESQADSLVTLVEDVQSLADVLTGDAERTPVRLDAVLAEPLAAVRRSHPNATVATDYPEETAVLGSDALTPVFGNILTNAVEHADRDDVRIRVEAARANGSVNVTVADDGPGVPESERESIFDRGVGSDDGGRGLYVAQTIVERLGGDVRVEDSELGGAAFVVTLPAADGAEPAN